ncbi:hypothetical protein LTR66_012420 [Elasticomyces elasticus]|nr:hypothetical protein LTR66_012420 [Elasticomyces elasticus]
MLTQQNALLPSSVGLPHVIPVSKLPRNLQEVNEAKAARRAEIEKRCAALAPPLLPDVLRHTESYQAAMQISQPLTDAAWGMLLPRLLAQRDAAEQIEYKRAEQMRIMQAVRETTQQQEVSSKPKQDALDREFENTRAPLRKTLAASADEIISEKWGCGKGLTKKDIPIFAADVLTHVRQRYQAEQGKQDAEEPSLVPHSHGDLVRPHLCLADMKWLFDAKVRPLIEGQTRDLFVCNACEGNNKRYAFEGMIQHYGAKHTTTFSKGNIVIHWQTADWPEEPPFRTKPVPKTSRDFVPGTDSAWVKAISSVPANASQRLAGPSRGTTATPQTAYLSASFLPMESPASALPILYSSTGLFAPPPDVANGYYDYAQAHQSAPYPYSTQTYGHPGQNVPAYAHYANQNPFVAGVNAYTQAGFVTSPQLHSPQTLSLARLIQSPGTGLASPTLSQFMSQQTNATLYHDQLNELAKVAREVWESTSGVRDLYQSVRLQVIIYHVVSKFNIRFSNEPNLDLFTDALATHVLMRPIKNANGLACKTCISSDQMGFAAYKSYSSRLGKTKLYNVSSLITHFKTVHLEGTSRNHEDSASLLTERLDWKRDMIELPEQELIADLVRAPGMDDDKLQTIAEAFPNIFPLPLPRIGLIRDPEPQLQARFGASRDASSWQDHHNKRSGKLNGKFVQPETSYTGGGVAPEDDCQTPPVLRDSQWPVPAPDVDEYDPRHPVSTDKGDGSKSTTYQHRERSLDRHGHLHDDSDVSRHMQHPRVEKIKPRLAEQDNNLWLRRHPQQNDSDHYNLPSTYTYNGLHSSSAYRTLTHPDIGDVRPRRISPALYAPFHRNVSPYVERVHTEEALDPRPSEHREPSRSPSVPRAEPGQDLSLPISTRGVVKYVPQQERMMYEQEQLVYQQGSPAMVSRVDTAATYPAQRVIEVLGGEYLSGGHGSLPFSSTRRPEHPVQMPPESLLWDDGRYRYERPRDISNRRHNELTRPDQHSKYPSESVELELRPRSRRYLRYEEQQRQFSKARSESPTVTTYASDRVYYRERSVSRYDPAAPSVRRSPVLMETGYVPMERPRGRQRSPVEHGYDQSSAPSLAPMYEDEYGQPIDFVRLRKPDPYVNTYHHPRDESTQYVPHGEVVRREPMPEARQYIYYEDQIAHRR